MKIRFAALSLLAATAFSSPAFADTAPGLDRSAIEQIVREYLLENPEIIVEAGQRLEARQQAEQAERAKLALAQYKDQLLNAPFTPVSGNIDGDVALVEFFDYQCGYCKRVMKDTADAVTEDGNVKMIYKEFPILGEVSVYAARAGLAAKMQDPALYKTLHLALMGYKGGLSERAIDAVAKENGVDIARMKEDMDHPDITAEIEANYQLAQALGINGTPGFVIGDQIIPGAVGRAALDQAIAAARK